MLPHITLTHSQQITFKGFQRIGDMTHEAGSVSIEQLEQSEGPVEAKLSGVDRDVILKALVGQNLIGIPEAQHVQFLRLAFDRQQYKRAIIAYCLRELNNFNLNSSELALSYGFLNMARLFDELFLAWRARVVESDLGQRAAQEPNFMTTFRTDHGLSVSPYTFSVIAGEHGTYREQPLAEAFPQVVQAIIQGFEALHADLAAAGASKPLLKYVALLATFFATRDPAQYEALSKQLDTLFIRLEGRLIPIHPMEVYEDPGKYCVSPDMRLCVLDDRYQHVNEGIRQTKAKLIGALQEKYAHVPALTASLPLMQRAQAAAYTNLSEAGASMTLRPFGENIPNWNDIRSAEGIRIFIFMETAKTRWVGEQAVLTKLLGSEAVATHFDPYVTTGQLFDYAGIVAVGGHEIAHNAFITSDVSGRLTPPLYAKVEEHKANLAILANIDTLYTAEEQKIIALYELGYSLMKMAQITDQTVVAYVNYSVFALNAFVVSGVLALQDGTFVLDVSPQKITAWIANLKTAFSELVPIYDHGTADDVQQYMSAYFSQTAAVQAILSKLGQ